MSKTKLSKEQRERIKKLQEELKAVKFTPEEITQMQEDARELKKVRWEKLYSQFTI